MRDRLEMDTTAISTPSPRHSRKKHWWFMLGPGLITGASDDDSAGIVTYLQAGTVMGLASLWLAVITLPLMYGVQEICGRIGLVTDKGLMQLMRERYSRSVVYPLAFIAGLVIVVNIGADLSAIAIILEKFSALSRFIWLPLVGVSIMLFMIFFSYQRFARVLKWLTLSLFFYVLTVFFMHINWLETIRATFLPSISLSRNNLLLIAAVLGTTISPYLFFWQASEEVEERRQTITTRCLKRFIITKHELKVLKEDVFWGMLISNLVAWFIMVGASYLRAGGVGEITSLQQAALVLRPALGDFAFGAFGLGIIGTGLLTVPVLSGGVGYILSEVFGWQEGMNKTFREAKKFYLVIIAATVVGVFLNFLHLDPITLLVYSAVLYTIITPPLIFIVLRIANDTTVMQHRTNSLWSNLLGYGAGSVMCVAALAYLASLFF